MTDRDRHPDADDLAWFRRALGEDPKLATAVFHDPQTVIGEFRSHNTALHLAADHQYGHPDFVALARLLLEHGADPNSRNDMGWTPLHYACAIDARDKDMVELLLESGADPNAATNRGETPLGLAFGSANEGEAIRAMLVAHGARPSQ
jgi:ankyrin repeat protein